MRCSDMAAEQTLDLDVYNVYSCVYSHHVNNVRPEVKDGSSSGSLFWVV